MKSKVARLSDVSRRDPLQMYAGAGLLTDIPDAPRAVERFKFIRQAESLGLTLGEIRALLRCIASQSQRYGSVRQRTEVTQ
jgi:DNA-binding transcriptional MerR regulator